MENKTKLIFSRKIALQLSRLGFPIIDIIENRNKKFIEIYVFENTKNFQKTFLNLVNKNTNIQTGGLNTNGNRITK